MFMSRIFRVRVQYISLSAFCVLAFKMQNARVFRRSSQVKSSDTLQSGVNTHYVQKSEITCMYVYDLSMIVLHTLHDPSSRR